MTRIRLPDGVHWLMAAFLVGIAGFATTILIRAYQTSSRDAELCVAIDHFVQVQEQQIRGSVILNRQQRRERISVFERFRDEIDCRDPLPDSLVSNP